MSHFEDFPAVHQDIIAALSDHFPAALPVDPSTMATDPTLIYGAMCRAQGRRDVVNFLQGVLNWQSEDKGRTPFDEVRETDTAHI